MARPIAADANATRQRILVAAGTAFSERGRGGASIRSISSAAGVSLAMVHHYFGSKDGLYQACIESMYAELAPMRASLFAELQKGGHLAELLERAVRTGFRFAREHQVPARLLFRQLTSRGELDPTYRENQQIPFLDATAAALSAVTGKPTKSLRLPIQSAVVLIARYGISSDTELEMFSGACPDPTAAVEDHLVTAVSALLIPSHSCVLV